MTESHLNVQVAFGNIGTSESQQRNMLLANNRLQGKPLTLTYAALKITYSYT